MTEQTQGPIATSDMLLMEIRSLADIYATGTHAENVLQRIRDALDQHAPNQSPAPDGERDERDELVRTLLNIQFADPHHVNTVMEGRETYPSFNDQAFVADGLLAAGYQTARQARTETLMAEPTSPPAEIDALARALQEHDPEPYYPGNWSDVAYYREYAAAILATGLRVIPAESRGKNDV